jgi:hypothetical protein
VSQRIAHTDRNLQRSWTNQGIEFAQIGVLRYDITQTNSGGKMVEQLRTGIDREYFISAIGQGNSLKPRAASKICGEATSNGRSGEFVQDGFLFRDFGFKR